MQNNYGETSGDADLKNALLEAHKEEEDEGEEDKGEEDDEEGDANDDGDEDGDGNGNEAVRPWVTGDGNAMEIDG